MFVTHCPVLYSINVCNSDDNIYLLLNSVAILHQLPSASDCDQCETMHGCTSTQVTHSIRRCTVHRGVPHDTALCNISQIGGLCIIHIMCLQTIDRLFDYLNSRNPRAKGFKAPIRAANWPYVSQFLQQSRVYLVGLTTEGGQPLHLSRR